MTSVFCIALCCGATMAAGPSLARAVPLTQEELMPVGGPAHSEGQVDCWNTTDLIPNPAIWVNSCPWVNQGLTDAGFTAGNGWTFRYADAAGRDFELASKLDITNYYAWTVDEPTVTGRHGDEYPGRFHEEDVGGAIFTAEYNPIGADPVNIHWVQAYRQRLGAGQPYTVHLDDPRAGDGVPWYDSGGAAGNDWFLDTPADPCRVECDYNTDVQFQLFVAVDNIVEGNHVVDLYEGLWWGYTYNCIPEPASILLMGLALGAVRRR
ncbi:MAG: PEP-CTERM sorting domain-containing protein [Planctomycetes bacterium]|nr:PEP-CTERM sorting domain-containing protein [Planctomycetota bacterium]